MVNIRFCLINTTWMLQRLIATSVCKTKLFLCNALASMQYRHSTTLCHICPSFVILTHVVGSSVLDFWEVFSQCLNVSSFCRHTWLPFISDSCERQKIRWKYFSFCRIECWKCLVFFSIVEVESRWSMCWGQTIQMCRKIHRIEWRALSGIHCPPTICLLARLRAT